MRISDWSSDVCSSDLPVLAPVMPQIVPRIAAMELAQVDQARQRRRIGGHRARRQKGRGLLIFAERRYLVEGQIKRLNAFTIEPPAFRSSTSAAQRIAGPLRRMCAEQRASGRQIPKDHPEKPRSEEHTSELQSLMRIPYAVFCLT